MGRDQPHPPDPGALLVGLRHCAAESLGVGARPPIATTTADLPGQRAQLGGAFMNDVSQPPRQIEILLVEDNPGDVRLTKEAFRDAKLANNLHVVVDGEAAIDFLRQRGAHASSPTPDLVLLDLNLPRKDGREVLTEIKADPMLKRIPVVVLTTSQADRDIIQSYDLHANCYITKPVDLDHFVTVVRSIQDFWFTTVKLP